MSVWIESHKALRDHWKVSGLGGDMGWNKAETIGKLHMFWWWCVDYCENGDLRKFNDAVIGSAVELNGEDCKRFVDSMKKWGFIDCEPFRVHDWWQYIGTFLQARHKRSSAKWKAVRDAYIPDDQRAEPAAFNSNGKDDAHVPVQEPVQQPVHAPVQERLQSPVQQPLQGGDQYGHTNQPTNQPKPTKPFAAAPPPPPETIKTADDEPTRYERLADVVGETDDGNIAFRKQPRKKPGTPQAEVIEHFSAGWTTRYRGATYPARGVDYSKAVELLKACGGSMEDAKATCDRYLADDYHEAFRHPVANMLNANQLVKYMGDAPPKGTNGKSKSSAARHGEYPEDLSL